MIRSIIQNPKYAASFVIGILGHYMSNEAIKTLRAYPNNSSCCVISVRA
jgi:hypothetical protein